MNLSPERQAEYDAIGLPWPLIIDMRIAPETNAGRPRFATDELLDFTQKAASAYHEQAQEIADLTEQSNAWENEAMQSRATQKLMMGTIEDLTAKVERLCNELERIQSVVGEEDFDIIEALLKESDPS